MNTWTFTTPEFALLSHFHFPELLPLDDQALQDLQIEAEDLDALQTRLEEEGWLIYTPGDETPGVRGDFISVLETLFFPDHVFILEVADLAATKGQNYIFSWGRAPITCNFVTPEDKQVIHVLEDVEAIIDMVFQYGLPPHYQPPSSPPPSSPTSLEALAESARMVVRWLQVADPAAPDPQVEAGGWVVTSEALWIFTSQQEKLNIAPADLDMLRAWIAKTVFVGP